MYFNNLKARQISKSIIVDSCYENNSEKDEHKVHVSVEPGLMKFWTYNLEDNYERLGIEVINLKSSKENAYLMETDITEVMNNIINKGFIFCCKTNKIRKPAVIIDAPTNAGKTTFVLEYLAEKAKRNNKKVLYLVNRTFLKLQVKKALIDRKFDMEQYNNLKKCNTSSSQTAYLSGCSDEIGNVIVMTYHSFLKNVATINKNEVDMVVCDEAHYFIADSGFNDSTDIQLKTILKEFSDSLRIYMSATLEEVASVIAYYEGEYLKGNNYCKGYNYGDECYYDCSGVKNVYYLKYKGIDKHIRFYLLHNNSDKELFEEVANICTKDKFKSLVFVDSKEKGRKLKNFINQMSKENESDIAKYIDADIKDGDTYNQIISESKFNCKVLISTSVLDNGVNIKDNELKNIILLTLDKVENVQSLGRKRFENKEVVNVYIPKFQENELRRKLTQVKQNLSEYEKIKNDAIGYVYDCYKNNTKTYLNIVRKIENVFTYNEFAHIKFEYEKANLSSLKEKYESSGSCMKEVLNWYGVERNEEFCKYTDNEYLLYKEIEYYANRQFSTEDKQEFLDEFKARADELLGKDSSENAERKGSYTIRRANNRIERLKMPFVFKESENSIFVEYSQENNVINTKGGDKEQENTVTDGEGGEDV